MKRTLFLLLICASILITPALAQAQSAGMSVTCDDGTSFENGVEVVVNQMRSGFTYTATAIGLNGFDPVLAVLDANTGQGLCSDDTSDASGYSANLPTTGFVPSSSLSSQVSFAQTSGNTFADVSLVVGGYGNVAGEFLLILEGMAVTDGDGTGDTFEVNITPGMEASGVPLSIYMITRGQSGVDPLLYLGDANLDPVQMDGVDVSCDDAGDAGLCYSPMDMTSSTVSIASGNLTTWDKDSVLSIDLSGISLDSERTQNYLTFVMTSYDHATEGQYLLAFHFGTTDDAGSGGLSGGVEQQTNNQNTQNQQQTNNGSPGLGYSVSCDDGTSFDNGVEVIVSQMRAGFTYTATAVGLNGFDPVLAVLDTSTGQGLCSDDDATAALYDASLPTASASASSLSSQVTFNQTSGNSFADISLVVGGYGNTGGEFLLFLEGMGATAEDNAGDQFYVNITPGVVASGTPITVYMITQEGSNLDPYIYEADSNANPIRDSQGAEINCDDAGSEDLCWGYSVDLSDYSVTLGNNTLSGWQYDAMLQLGANIQLSSDRTENYFRYIASSSPQNTTEGQYLLVFHIGQSN